MARSGCSLSLIAACRIGSERRQDARRAYRPTVVAVPDHCERRRLRCGALPAGLVHHERLGQPEPGSCICRKATARREILAAYGHTGQNIRAGQQPARTGRGPSPA